MRILYDDSLAHNPAGTGTFVRGLRTGLQARIISLPAGHDPNSYFAAGATASEFRTCLKHAQAL